ncbi:MAG TPA: hypothetical protein PKD37_07320 [Oligoflexia bacterium]|nr:hypothetical protein [Oligoflexia bacterium]HMP27772.1 hypothetical protein [Oligoflexia bacterium]
MKNTIKKLSLILLVAAIITPNAWGENIAHLSDSAGGSDLSNSAGPDDGFLPGNQGYEIKIDAEAEGFVEVAEAVYLTR